MNIKLFDRLSPTHQKQVLKHADKDTIKTLKSTKSFHLLTYIDVRILWLTIHPKLLFNTNEFNLLFQ